MSKYDPTAELPDLEEQLKREPWFRRLNELQKRWVPNDPEHRSAHESLMQEVLGYVYIGCMTSPGGYTQEDRDLAFDHVLTDLARYDPAKKSLGGYVSAQIRNRLNGAYTRRKDAEAGFGPSIDDQEQPPLPDGTPPLDERVGEDDAAGAVITALVLNFTRLKKQRPDSAVRHYRLFYTEQITGSAQIAPLPQRWGRDILEALHHPYFRHFISNVSDDQTIGLSTIEYAVPKKYGEVVPGQSMDQLLPWDKGLFLPAKVQIGYLLQKEQLRISAATVSSRKKEYQDALLSLRSDDPASEKE